MGSLQSSSGFYRESLTISITWALTSDVLITHFLISPFPYFLFWIIFLQLLIIMNLLFLLFVPLIYCCMKNYHKNLWLKTIILFYQWFVNQEFGKGLSRWFMSDPCGIGWGSWSSRLYFQDGSSLTSSGLQCSLASLFSQSLPPWPHPVTWAFHRMVVSE